MLAALLLAYGSVTVSSPLASQAGLYLADRNAGLSLLLVVLVLLSWNRALGVTLMATAAIHLVDGSGDLWMGNVPAGIGSIIVAAVSALAAWLLITTESRHAELRA